jgi:hypothetical protein
MEERFVAVVEEETYTEAEIDNVEFAIAMIDLLVFGVYQPEGLEKLYMN